VYDISIRLTTPIDRFAEFVGHNYSLFTASKTKTVDIDVTYSEQAGKYAAERKEEFRRFGGGMYISTDCLYWENEYGFRLLVSIREDGTLAVHAFHHDLLRKSDTEERFKDFQRSMRWAIHFPLFTRLQYRRGWSLLHSSAVVKDGRAIVFCGLNKVGKSTLAVYLCEKHGYNLMTDNFLLVGDDTLYGFPEVIRLSPTAADRLGLSSVWDDLVYGKYHVAPDTIGTELQASPEAFFLISQGSELQSRSVNPSTTWETMRNLHSYLGEFPEQSYLGMWPYITKQTMNTKTATETVTTTPWYELSYEPDWNFEAVVSEIEACI
jgi:hypothetical protein